MVIYYGPKESHHSFLIVPRGCNEMFSFHSVASVFSSARQSDSGPETKLHPLHMTSSSCTHFSYLPSFTFNVRARFHTLNIFFLTCQSLNNGNFIEGILRIVNLKKLSGLKCNTPCF